MKITELRKQLNLTQEQLAEKTGTSVQIVQNLEKGEIGMSGISFLDGIRLLLTLNEAETDEELMELSGCVRSTYIMMKLMLDENN